MTQPPRRGASEAFPVEHAAVAMPGVSSTPLAAPLRFPAGPSDDGIAGSSSKLPYVASSLVLFFPFFGTLLPNVFGIASFLVGVALFAGWSAKTRPRASFLVRSTWAWWAVYGLVALVGALVSAMPHSRTPLYTVAILGAVVLGLVLSNTGGWQKPALVVFVLFSAVLAAATVLFYFFPALYADVVRPALYPNLGLGTDYREGLRPNRTQNAVLIAAGLIVCVSGLLVRGARAPWRRYALGAAVFLAFALMLTSVRGPLLSAFVGVAVVGLATSPGKRALRVAAGLAGAIAGVFALSLVSVGVRSSLERLLGTLDATNLDTATTGRAKLWDAALEGWQGAPLFGRGWGTFQYWYNGSASQHLAHNEVLNSLYETGIFGTAVYVVAAISGLVTTLRACRRHVRLGTFNASAYVPLAASATLQVFLLFYGNTTGQLLGLPYTFVIYFFVLALGTSKLQREPRGISGGCPYVVCQAVRAGSRSS